MDVPLFESGAIKIVTFIQYVLGAVAILYMLLGAVRMIMASGDESIIDEEKKNFTWGFF